MENLYCDIFRYAQECSEYIVCINRLKETLKKVEEGFDERYGWVQSEQFGEPLSIWLPKEVIAEELKKRIDWNQEGLQTATEVIFEKTKELKELYESK